MNIKKIVASAGIAVGAVAAMAGTASAAPQLPTIGEIGAIDPIGKISELGEGAGLSTLHDLGDANVEIVHDGTHLIGG